MFNCVILCAIGIAHVGGLPVWQNGSGYRDNTSGLYNFTGLNNMRTLQGDFGQGYNNVGSPGHDRFSHNYNHGSSGYNHNQGVGYNTSRGMWPSAGQGNRSYTGSTGSHGPGQNVGYNSNQGSWNASNQWNRGPANSFGTGRSNNSQATWQGGNRSSWNSSAQKNDYNFPNQQSNFGAGQTTGYTGNSGSNYGQWNSSNHGAGYHSNPSGLYSGGQGNWYGATGNNRNSTGFNQGYNSQSGGFAPAGGNSFGSIQNPWQSRNNTSPFDVRFGGNQRGFNQSSPIIY